jgi:hypothetical protein
MALVVVLTVVVLAAILVAAFVSVAMLERSSSGHYASSLRAEEVARAGYTTVLADLRREISAGSVLVTNASGNILFAMPRTNWTMLPQTNAVLTNAPALVRFSSTNLPPAFTNTAWFDTSALPPNRASAVSTATRSRNNRSISAATWLAPQFAPTNNAATLAALTNNPPTWTYITRSGARALTDSDAATAASNSSANTNFVVGRYAFAIYDTGGMLDANLAGAPTNLVSPEWLATKASQAFADLTQVGLTAAQSDALVQWRNAASAANLNSYSSYIRISGPTNGFAMGPTGDRAFFSRRDFLRYATANNWTSDAIAAFTTFQRDPAHPAFFPTYDASTYKAAGIAAAAANAYRTSSTNVSASNFNPAMAAVRTAAGKPVVSNRFNLDRLLWVTREGPISSLGSSNPIYTSALAALGGGSVAAAFLAQGTPANIQKYFGLFWDSNAPSWTPGTPSATTGETGQQWIYCSPTGSLAARAASIKTLAQVAAENREPDLFELLQVVVLSGSLGHATGNSTTYGGASPPVPNSNSQYGEWERRALVLNSASTVQNRFCHAPELRMDRDNRLFHAEPKYQVARIVANLIDQADADSFPTALRLNDEVVWGIEDLPYINGIGMFAARPPAGNAVTPNDNSRHIHQWALFSLWNPHAIGSSPSGPAPVTLRIICRSGVSRPATYRARFIASNGAVQDFSVTAAAENFLGSPSAIQFSMSDYAGFREPTVINPATGATVSSPNNRLTVGRVDVAGIHTGSTDVPDHPAYVPPCAGLPITTNDPVQRYAEDIEKFPSSDIDSRGLMWGNGNSLNIELQYLDSNSSWRTYDAVYGFIPEWTQNGFTNYLMPDDPNYATSISNMEADVAANKRPRIASVQKAMLLLTNFNLVNPAHLRTDPRTGRLNMGKSQTRAAETGVPNTSAINSADVGQLDKTMAPDNLSNGATDLNGWNISSMMGQTFWTTTSQGNSASSMYANNFSELAAAANYADPDFVQRWGDAGLRANNHPGTSGNAAARPVILNRPFRNVGELGVVFRDSPWRTLDLLSEKSADAGLLEIFCVGEQPASAIAGQVNINSAPLPVLRALISGADRMLNLSATNLISSNSAATIATNVIASRQTRGPLESLSQLPLLFPQTNSVDANYPAPKVQREASARALAGVGTTRTWNLLVDVIAQSGKLAANASNLSSDFIVEGQKRYWLHVSIDRLTGEVIASTAEPFEE